MIFSPEKLCELRESVKFRLTKRRFEHTLGVEAIAIHIGFYLMPQRLDELRVAALLHDIAKNLPIEELERLVEGMELSKENLETSPALHSFAAVPIIQRDYPEFATKSVLDAVYNHTLGSPEMDIFSEIIFVSDYIEMGRTYQECKEIGSYLSAALFISEDEKSRIAGLHKASIKAIDYTTQNLKNKNQPINSTTIATKQYLESLI